MVVAAVVVVGVGLGFWGGCRVGLRRGERRHKIYCDRPGGVVFTGLLVVGTAPAVQGMWLRSGLGTFGNASKDVRTRQRDE